MSECVVTFCNASAPHVPQFVIEAGLADCGMYVCGVHAEAFDRPGTTLAVLFARVCRSWLNNGAIELQVPQLPELNSIQYSSRLTYQTYQLTWVDPYCDQWLLRWEMQSAHPASGAIGMDGYHFYQRSGPGSFMQIAWYKYLDEALMGVSKRLGMMEKLAQSVNPVINPEMPKPEPYRGHIEYQRISNRVLPGQVPTESTQGVRSASISTGTTSGNARKRTVSLWRGAPADTPIRTPKAPDPDNIRRLAEQRKKLSGERPFHS